MTEETDKIITEMGFGQYVTSKTEEDDKKSFRLGKYVPAKSKTQQPKTVYTPQGRDSFQTPNYAVDLLVPFIPKDIKMIWEPAAGGGKIADRLRTHHFRVWSTDIYIGAKVHELVNFLDGQINFPFECIITNPPFSLKIDFFEKCMEYDMPFALLIPADYAGWNITACRSMGCEKIIPTRRVDYITPSGKSGESGHTADFHSMWLTWGFGLGKTETFVELSLEWKKNNI